MRQLNFFTTLPAGWQIFIAIVVLLFIVIMAILIKASKDAMEYEQSLGRIIHEIPPDRDEEELDEFSPENIEFEETLHRLKTRNEIDL